jgi:hypothetical protein
VKKSLLVLIVGVILLLSSIAILLFFSSTAETNVKMITLERNEDYTINYTLEKGNYTLVIQSSGKIHYQLINSSGIIDENDVSNQSVVFLPYLEGQYTLRITNIGNTSTDVVIFLESEEKISSLGIMVLGSGGLCLSGIIVIIIGAILIYKERRSGENVY